MGMHRHFMKKLIYFGCLTCVVTILVKLYYANNNIEILQIDGKKNSREKYIELHEEIEAESEPQAMDLGKNELTYNTPVGNDIEAEEGAKPEASKKSSFKDEIQDSQESLGLQNKKFIERRYKDIRESLKNISRLSDTFKNIVTKPERNDELINSQESDIVSDTGRVDEDNLLFVRAMGNKNFKRHESDAAYFEEIVTSNGKSNETVSLTFDESVKSNINSNDTEILMLVERVSLAATKPTMDVNIDEGSNRLLPTASTSLTFTNLSRSGGSRNDLDLSAMDSFGNVERIPDYELPILKNNPGIDKTTVLISNVSRNMSEQRYFFEPAVADKAKQERIEEPNISGAPKVIVEVYNDQPMSGVVIIGIPNNTRNYAVFSTTSDNREAVNFVFLIPLTTLAWKRAGFDSVVIVVGSADEWKADPFFNYVLMSACKMDAVFVFLEPRPEKSIMISQVSLTLLYAYMNNFR